MGARFRGVIVVATDKFVLGRKSRNVVETKSHVPELNSAPVQFVNLLQAAYFSVGVPD